MVQFCRVLVLLCVMFGGVAVAQDSPPKQDVVQEVSESKFRRALLRAADAAAKKGELKRADVIKLRVATLSPAFLERAEMLAKIQISASGEEIPVGEDGKIEIADWEEFGLFLERLIKLILMLIDAFGVLDSLGSEVLV